MCNQNIISNKFNLILTTTLSSYYDWKSGLNFSLFFLSYWHLGTSLTSQPKTVMNPRLQKGGKGQARRCRRPCPTGTSWRRVPPPVHLSPKVKKLRAGSSSNSHLSLQRGHQTNCWYYQSQNKLLCCWCWYHIRHGLVLPQLLIGSHKA